MAFDTPTRNRLARFVGDCRTLLTEEFTRQLQNDYGLDPESGDLADVETLTHLDDAGRETARILRDTMHHYVAGSTSKPAIARKDALNRIVREQAFTVLNRLCALRMAEARQLFIESIANGFQSQGFQLYSRLAGPSLGETGDAYRMYLLSVFDELALDLGILFDRYSAEGRLFPRGSVLLDVLEQVNHPDLETLWPEDETIGWIYQYFNSKEERKAMRDASQAPRNSRELAVRNQFFTPRYVVEFLTDNTLGRIWYEMRKGETRLKDECQYLVRRPNEFFLAEGEEAPQDETNEHAEHQEKELTQEELLNQPVHIPYRSLRDPRDIRTLDPACGSMHFGLYAFDLYLKIYEEFWDLVSSDRLSLASEDYGNQLDTDHRPLATDYSDKADFMKAVPKLIIEHNIHGIDIDPRAVQIARLSLWLRAQRAWKSQGLTADKRPQVTRSNVVCAEPMPGDKQQLETFCKELHPAIAQMVTAIFEEMKLAGEAGSLLKIEQEIKSLVAAAKKQFQDNPPDKKTQMQLFGGVRVVKEQQLEFDLSDITDEQFFEKAEEDIYDTLRRYADQTSDGGFCRKLFAHDAEKGFAFIELCRNTFDVLLMNPPFGDSAKPSSSLIKKSYKNCKADILQAFVERCLSLSRVGGLVGTLSARTGFFLGESKKWRENVVFQNALRLFADLGLGVLDDALVEVAAYVIESRSPEANIVLTNRQLHTKEKEEGLRIAFAALSLGQTDGVRCFEQELVSIIPDFTFGYWAPSSILRRYDSQHGFGRQISKVRQGIASADDFRFARLAWEVPANAIGQGQRWRRFSKGGEYSPVLDDVHLLIDWKNDGRQLAAFPRARFQNVSYMFRPGGSHPSRTASALAPRVLPAGCVFSHMSQAWFGPTNEETLGSIGFMLCRTPQAYIEIGVGGGDVATAGSVARRYTSAVVEGIPADAFGALMRVSASTTDKLFRHQLLRVSSSETSAYFIRLHLSPQVRSLQDAANAECDQILESAVEVLADFAELDVAVAAAFSLTDTEVEFVDEEVGCHPNQYDSPVDSNECANAFGLSAPELMALAVERHGPRRWITKKSYFVDRRLELICHLFESAPKQVVDAYKSSGVRLQAAEYAQAVISESVGIVFGRWFVEHAQQPKIESPFSALPDCPVPMLPRNPSMARSSFDVVPESSANDGQDLFAMIRSVLKSVWGDRAEQIESELSLLLGSEIQEYISQPAGYFESHLATYSRSRRSAPIYWPIATESGSYTLWLYYHRLTDQTLYRAVIDFVDPKLKETGRQLADFRAIKDRSSAQEKEFAGLTELKSELEQFKADLLEIAAFWKPNLNDGVQITAAPLWKFFRLTKWRNKLKKTWKELQAGAYDWAHLAMSIWPERVVPKCVGDRSLAIAHDLEDLFWVEDFGKWRNLNEPDEEIEEQKRRQRLTARERVRKLLEKLATDHKTERTGDVYEHLANGDWDDHEVALLIWPERVAEECWEDAAIAAKLKVKLPDRRTKAARKRFIAGFVSKGCPDLAEQLSAAMKCHDEPLQELWQELADGERDEESLALSLWPDRVVDKCTEDVDLAETHNIHRFFWVQHPTKSWRRRLSPEVEVRDEVARRSKQ